MEANPTQWRNFGPYWPAIAPVLAEFAGYNADWAQATPPDYLSHYRYNNPLLDWIAAMEYLNRDRYYAPGSAHSIVLPDGDRRLYQPGVGLVAR